MKLQKSSLELISVEKKNRKFNQIVPLRLTSVQIVCLSDMISLLSICRPSEHLFTTYSNEHIWSINTNYYLITFWLSILQIINELHITNLRIIKWNLIVELSNRSFILRGDKSRPLKKSSITGMPLTNSSNRTGVNSYQYF